MHIIRFIKLGFTKIMKLLLRLYDFAVIIVSTRSSSQVRRIRIHDLITVE